MPQVKRLEVEAEKGDFSIIVFHSATSWMLSIQCEGETIFSAAGDTKEAVLRRLDDFIAGLIELSRCAENMMKKMEGVEESLTKE